MFISGKREPYHFDFKEVCAAAVDNNVCLEINAFPIRLDLNGANVYHARKYGVKFVIDTDAHRTDHMDFMKFGVTTARRGWLRKKDVLNTLSYRMMKPEEMIVECLNPKSEARQPELIQ